MWFDLGAVTGKLAMDSRNIVDLVQESYNVSDINLELLQFSLGLMIRGNKAGNKV